MSLGKTQTQLPHLRDWRSVKAAGLLGFVLAFASMKKLPIGPLRTLKRFQG
jgi:hypothetical protein